LVLEEVMGQTTLEHQVERIAQECGGVVSVAVKNIENALDWSINPDIVMSAASVIKVPLLVEALRQVKAGRFSLDDEYPVDDSFQTKGSGIVRYLHQGIKLTFADMLTLMIIVSDNATTNKVIDLVGMDNVNATMSAMGCPNTLLRRKMMDWQAIEEGRDNITTAAEMSDLLARIAKKEAVGGELDEYILKTLQRQQDTCKLGLFLPDGAEVGNKTGGRTGVQNDCGIVIAKDFSYSISVFTQDAKAWGEAVVSIGRISRAVYDYIGALQ
jgi:beta-lactamase class A